MSGPHFEFVRTKAGWHLRLRGGNGEPVVTGEVLTKKATAVEALATVCHAVDLLRASSLTVEEVDERPEGKPS